MMIRKMILPLAAGLLLLSCTLSRKIAKQQNKLNAIAIAKADTTKKDSAKKVKPYSEVITAKAITQNGLFKVHHVNDRWYFEIADSLFDKDILVVNRISKAPAGEYWGYAGDWISENVIEYTKGPNHKVFLRQVSYSDVSRDSSESGMIKSILNSSLQPIVGSFDIKAVSPDSMGVVIDLTDFINSDNAILFFDPALKRMYKLAALQADKSYVANIRSFPLNTEVRTVKTYISGADQVTYELNNSFVMLPADIMRARSFDQRVGYFSRGYRNFDNPQGVKANYMITRWRLEPKEEDIGKYMRGELVEPKKPIVFYIDPATPKKWVPYLIQGVNAWQKAFEKAGFKNAIYALEAPVDDTTWSIDDARHNVIIYKASVIQNASGPQVSDPRSGEILESHINWYHNVQQVLHDWYFVQASPLDPAAQKWQFPDSLMGKLIRYVCTHEVGHTLGLQHNFVASSSTPVDSLRSRKYIALNGHCPSIMDYARFNYVAQPEDSIAVNDLIPRIGVYDEWAIDWGYRWFPGFKTEQEETTFFNNWIIQSLKKDKRLFFVNNLAPDPRNQMEDLGDDAMKASAYGIKNLQTILKNLKQWTSTPNSDYTEYRNMYVAITGQYRRYLNHVLMNIGKLYYTPVTIEQGEFSFSFPDKEKMRSAVRFLNEQLFRTPKWLIKPEYFYRGTGASVVSLKMIQEWYIHQLVNFSNWNQLVFNEEILPGSQSYSYNQLLDDLESEIWKELKNHQVIDMYRRDLQKMYVFHLETQIRFSGTGDMAMFDCFSIAHDHLKKLLTKINKALPYYKDYESRTHLIDLRERINAVMLNHRQDLPEWPKTAADFILPGNGIQNLKADFKANNAPTTVKQKSGWEEDNWQY